LNHARERLLLDGVSYDIVESSPLVLGQFAVSPAFRGQTFTERAGITGGRSISWE
jgi:hypothetical protein